MKKIKVLLLSLVLLCPVYLYAKGGYSSGGSRSSSSSGRSYSSGSSSRSSGSSSSGRSYSAPKSNSSSSSSSKPSYSSPSKPSSNYSAPKSSSKPSSNYSSKSPSVESSSSSSSSVSSSSKPSTSVKPPINGTSEKALANKQLSSQNKYQAQIKNRADTNTIKSKPYTEYTPKQRENRTNIHITNYHYSHPYSYYSSQPFFNVGGGYSYIFWWMMMDWSAERRAQWFYHNQNNIDKDAYEKGMQDAVVAMEVAKLKAANTPVDSNYVDPEFKDNPDLMYSQEYVNDVVEPEPIQQPVVQTVAPSQEENLEHEESNALGIFLLFVLVFGGIFVFVFLIKWGE